MATRKPKEEVVKKEAPVKAVPKKTAKPRAKKVVVEEIIAPKNKAQATRMKQPWVAVLETHVNPADPSNGFFELDWNEYFIVQLKQAGYTGESEELIVDQWFSELCRNVGAEEGVNMDRRGSGFINVSSLGNGKAEIS
jgi:hypothetical protein